MNFNDIPYTYLLIAVNIIFSLIGFSNNQFRNTTILWPYQVKRKNQYWRIFTSGFLHADYLHLFFNMFTLFFFGAAVETRLTHYDLGGNVTYLLLYFSAMIVADIPSLIKYKDAYNYKSLGASGAVSAIVFAAIVFTPWSSIYLYGAIKISATLYAILFIAYCVYMGKKRIDNINHDAHLWGALYGILFTLACIQLLHPELMDIIIEEFKKPSLLGR